MDFTTTSMLADAIREDPRFELVRFVGPDPMRFTVTGWGLWVKVRQSGAIYAVNNYEAWHNLLSLMPLPFDISC